VTLEFQVLGRIDLRDGDRDGDHLASILARPKRLALLAYLCLESTDGPLRRDTLLPVFWPDSDEAHARAALNQALHVLRSALGPQVVTTRGRDEVGIDFETLRCDAVAFRRALASDARRTALDLYSGELLPGFHIGESGFDRWLDAERTTLRADALDAALALGASEDAAGDREAALDTYASFAHRQGRGDCLPRRLRGVSRGAGGADGGHGGLRRPAPMAAGRPPKKPPRKSSP